MVDISGAVLFVRSAASELATRSTWVTGGSQYVAQVANLRIADAVARSASFDCIVSRPMVDISGAVLFVGFASSELATRSTWVTGGSQM